MAAPSCDGVLAVTFLRGLTGFGVTGTRAAGSDSDGERAALMYKLIETAKLNGLNPEAYLRQVISRVANHPARCIAELLPWNIN
jgi:transposase